MALRFRIVSEQRHALGPRSDIVFGVGGGTVGRSAENDWILPDPSRYVSSRHARVYFRHGIYYLEDVSSNGTYLNDADEAMPKGTPCELNNGDMLRFGEYEVVVAIDAAGEALLPASAPPRGDRTAEAELELSLITGRPAAARDSGLMPQVRGHLDTQFDASALFAKPGEMRTAVGGNGLDASDKLAVGGAFGQNVVVPFASQRATAAGPGRPAPTPESGDTDRVAARRLERLQRLAAEREAAVAVNTPASQSPSQGPAMHSAQPAHDSRSGLEELCRGAGIDATLLSADASAAMLQLAGRLLRETLVGLRALDLKQRDILQQYRVPPKSAESTPSGFDLGRPADELLTQLLASHDSRRLDAAQWLRQSLERLKRHEDSVSGGTRAAIAQLLTQLDPKDLEERFERSAARNLMGARPTNWELYRELFRSLRESGDTEGVPHTFAESFATAYRTASDSVDADK